MKLLFTSRRQGGAFTMRGEQTAATRPNWQASTAPTPSDLDACDALVVVRDPDHDVLTAARARRLPVVYDPLDFWRQRKPWWLPPSRAQRISGSAEARALFERYFRRLGPDLIVCVTKRMGEDLSVFAPTAWLPHHADPRLPDAETYRTGCDRAMARKVLYFGKRRFLREWEARIAAACARQDAELITCDIRRANYIHPPPAHAMVAVRGGRDGCWLSRNWKSNVKAATAAALGLPLIAWPEAAYVETAPDAYWFTSISELEAAIKAALGPGARAVSRRFTAEQTARAYESILAKHFGLLPDAASRTRAF